MWTRHILHILADKLTVNATFFVPGEQGRSTARSSPRCSGQVTPSSRTARNTEHTWIWMRERSARLDRVTTLCVPSALRRGTSGGRRGRASSRPRPDPALGGARLTSPVGSSTAAIGLVARAKLHAGVRADRPSVARDGRGSDARQPCRTDQAARRSDCASTGELVRGLDRGCRAHVDTVAPGAAGRPQGRAGPADEGDRGAKPGVDWPVDADVAQLVEHFTRNEGVRGSSPRVGSQKVPEVGAFL